MVLWIGVDDTDSLGGMCTTYLATELIRALTDEYDLIGYPRLVRLNPNIPWKTRGNGAICVRVGRGSGPADVVGEIDGHEMLSYARWRGPADPRRAEEIVDALVTQWARFDDGTTNPGFAVLVRPPSPSLYWKAVRGIVLKEEALRFAAGLGVVREYKNGRGVIGALSAIAWRPRDRTYEILAYRDPGRWGTRRQVDEASVIEMDRALPSTFNNFDYDNERVVIAPRSPCPILFGIRGDDPKDLRRAIERIRGEEPERWFVFETNQGTDDHVVRTRRPIPRTTIRFQSSVSEEPVILPGGHVVLRLPEIQVTAYEPSKQFRQVVRQLLPGDRVEVVGAVRENPRTLNLEKLRVISPVRREVKVANPVCPSCGKHAKSMGRGRPFRCARCGLRLPRSKANFSFPPRAISEGWYEPPVGSRRHLSKPLKRMRGPPQSYAGLGRLLNAKPGNPVSTLEVLDDL